MNQQTGHRWWQMSVDLLVELPAETRHQASMQIWETAWQHDGVETSYHRPGRRVSVSLSLTADDHLAALVSEVLPLLPDTVALTIRRRGARPALNYTSRAASHA
ncbi:hypothetical protein [Actinomadura kijaniata]|uniref:hypothetical protein n=1 Tax=Actinomadura kijaniata TaxID=46161 RepID=UPI0008323426|nr:hypothetical protein [Actinomadura kijaniata]